MKVLISGHFLKPSKVGGVETMFYNLSKSILLTGNELYIIKNYKEEFQLKFYKEINLLGGKFYNTNFCSNRFINDLTFPITLKNNFKVTIFPNYFTPPYLPSRLGKIITVIHDLQYIHFPGYFSPQKRKWLYWSHKMTLKRADLVVAISKETRNDLIKVYGELAAKKVSVIPNPIDWSRLENIYDGLFPYKKPYILSVSHHFPHKNIETLIKAFKIIHRKLPKYNLILVGQSSGNLTSQNNTALITDLVSELKLNDSIHFTGHIEDEKLGVIFQHSSAFAFPSLFEGFGMPVVEAMGLGIPCVVSKTSCLPETTLNLVNYVDNPTDPEEWASLIISVLKQKNQNRLSEIARIVREVYSLQVIGKSYQRAFSAQYSGIY